MFCPANDNLKCPKVYRCGVCQNSTFFIGSDCSVHCDMCFSVTDLATIYDTLPKLT